MKKTDKQSTFEKNTIFYAKWKVYFSIFISIMERRG